MTVRIILRHNIIILLKYKIYITSGIVLSILIIISALTVAKGRLSLSGRAENKISSLAISKENSYLFVSPLQAQADGQSLIRMTAFIVDDRGLGASGKKVSLEAPPELSVREVASTTDNFGRAIFDISSVFAGKYTISAEVDGVSLPARVVILFHWKSSL